jgi:hypothetical protein
MKNKRPNPTMKDVLSWLARGTIRGFIDKTPPAGEQQKKKRAKYGNNKVHWNGMVFDSTKEYKRYRELLLLLKAGLIGQLERQVKYDLVVDGVKIGTYIADHVYIDAETGQKVVEDVKSDATRMLPVYRRSKKHMKAQYNIEILEK